MEEEFRNIQFKIASVGEHVPKIERSVQTVKGDTRALYHSMPYHILPPIMIKEMVESQVLLRNKFPSLNGIYEYMSPLTIMTSMPNPSYAGFKIEFGQYVQVHDHPNVTNNMKPRTTPAIVLGASKSENGWYFMSLETGKKILRYRWTPLPISQSVIDRVHKMANHLKIKNKSTSLALFSEEPDYKSDHNSVNNDMKNQKSYDERVSSAQTDGKESFEALANSPNYRSKNTSYHITLESDTTSSDSQRDRAAVEGEVMENSIFSDVEDMGTIASFGEFDTSDFAPQSIHGEFQTEEWTNKSVLNDAPYYDYREVDEDSVEYEQIFESNANNNPKHDTKLVSNEINTKGEERSEDGGTVGHVKEQNDINHIQNTEEKHNKRSDDRYKVRKLRSQTTCGEFERTFYDYKYNMWQCDNQIYTTKKGIMCVSLR